MTTIEPEKTSVQRNSVIRSLWPFSSVVRIVEVPFEQAQVVDVPMGEIGEEEKLEQ